MVLEQAIPLEVTFWVVRSGCKRDERHDVERPGRSRLCDFPQHGGAWLLFGIAMVLFTVVKIVKMFQAARFPPSNDLAFSTAEQQNIQIV